MVACVKVVAFFILPVVLCILSCEMGGAVSRGVKVNFESKKITFRGMPVQVTCVEEAFVLLLLPSVLSSFEFNDVH